MNPLPGTTIDTSPTNVGLPTTDNATSPHSDSEGQEKSGLLSRTLDKLSRSKSLSASKKVDPKGSGEPTRSKSKRISMSGIVGRRKKGSNPPTADNESSGADAPRADASAGGIPKSEVPNNGQ